MWIFYGISLTLILGGGVGAFLLSRRHGFVRATLLALMTMGLLVASWPLPIHGGFTFLGEAVWDEWTRERELRRAEKKAEAESAFSIELRRRFAGPLGVSFVEDVPGTGWQVVEDAAGRRSRLDTENGMIWSPRIELLSNGGMPSLEDALARCEKLPPEGYWSLATETEYLLARRHGVRSALPGGSGSLVSHTIDIELQMDLPTYDLRPSQLESQQEGRSRPERDFGVHCVARTSEAPERGFVREDVTTEEWNRYQLSKTSR